MRDALTLMDKCLSYSETLVIENVLKALGTVNYDMMFELTDSIIYNDNKKVLEIIENLYLSGVDLKQFIKTYMHFILDVNKYFLTENFVF